MNSTDTTENATACNCSPDTDARCASCLTADVDSLLVSVKKLSEESGATATFVEELREELRDDINDKMSERDVESAIENAIKEAFEEHDRDSVSESDVTEMIEHAVEDLNIVDEDGIQKMIDGAVKDLHETIAKDAENEFATSQALNDLDGSVNEMINELAGEVRLLRGQLEALQARTLRARVDAFVARVRTSLRSR